MREPEFLELDWTSFVTKIELREFFELNLFRIFIDAVAIWATILGVLWLWSVTSGLWQVVVWPVCILVIGARQHALNNVVHDGAHYSISRNKVVNDIISDLFFAAPHFISTADYRHKHAPHHTDLGDPRKDIEFKARYVISRGAFWPRVLKTLVGETAWRTARQYTERSKSSVAQTILRLLFVGMTNGALVAYCWGIGVPAAYLHLWLLPLVTVTPLLATLRVIAEHQPFHYAANGVEDWSNPLRPAITRSIYAGPVSRFFLAPMNFCYHLEHHIWPSVPYSQLPRLSRLLRTRGFYDRYAALHASSYAEVLRSLIDAPKASEAVAPRNIAK